MNPPPSFMDGGFLSIWGSPMARVMVFIDGSNFYHGLKKNDCSHQVDFNKLGNKLAGDDELHTIYYYNATVPEKLDPERYRKQQRFFAAVQSTPYVIMRLGRLEPRDDGMVEKGVDILIAVDMLQHAYTGSFDTAIRVSGDGDFAEAVKAITQLGRIVKNAYFSRGRSNQLINVCHDFIELSADYLQDCQPD